MLPVLSLDLPWPSAKLGQNARGHWGKKSSATQKARKAAWGIALAAGARQIAAESVVISYTFFPPNKSRYDDDNLVGRCKAYRDGIADALGMDDFKFNIGTVRRDAPKAHGAVRIEIEVVA